MSGVSTPIGQSIAKGCWDQIGVPQRPLGMFEEHHDAGKGSRVQEEISVTRKRSGPLVREIIQLDERKREWVWFI